MKQKSDPSCDPRRLKNTKTGEAHAILNRLFHQNEFHGRLLYGLSSLLLVASPAHAQGTASQDIGLEANVVSRRLNVGEVGTLLIKAANGEASNIPSRIDVQGLDIVKTGEQISMTLSNGVKGYTKIYYYQIRPISPGSYTIPPVTADVQGKPCTTKPIQITVVQASNDDLSAQATKPYFGRINLEAKEVYVNQLVPFDVTVFARGRSAISDVSNGKLENESFVVQNFKQVKLDTIELGGNIYSTARLPSNFFALKPGHQTLGPSQVTIRVIEGRSPFGFPSIFQRTRSQKILTDTVAIDVKPLPPGAPASFTGGVGDFQMDASASTTSVSIGDPISMTFEVTGVGNLGTLGAPQFSGIAQTETWKTYEPGKTLDPAWASDGITSGHATFSQVIIPLTKTGMIPPFELTFFDPAKAQYVTRKTQPISITVKPGNEKSSTTTVAFPHGEGPTQSQSKVARPTPQFPDVLHIRTRKPKWRPYTALVPGSSGGPGLFVFHFVCSIAFFTLLAFGVTRRIQSRRLERSQRSQVTFRQSLRSIPKPGTPRHDFYHAIAHSLDLWEKEHPTASPKVLQAIHQLNQKCNAILYGGKQNRNLPLSAQEADEFLVILKKLPGG